MRGPLFSPSEVVPIREYDSIEEVEDYVINSSFGSQASIFGRDPKVNPEPIGRALVAVLSENEFLVTGAFCRVDFKPSDPALQREFVRVEEGGYEKGEFRAHRIWNGDETDWGLNFASGPQAVRVVLGTY